MGSRIAVSRTQLMTSMTIVPFLYQTKTICNNPPLRGVLRVALSQRVPHTIERSLHSSSRIAYAHARNQARPTEQSSFTVRRVGTDEAWGPEVPIPSDGSGPRIIKSYYDGKAGRQDDKPVRRRIRSHPEREIGFSRAIRPEEIEAENDMDFGIDLDTYEEDQGLSNFRMEAGDMEPSAARKSKESTITPTEKIAFERIFADIMARQKSQSYEGHNNRDKGDTNAGFRRQPNETVQSIMDDAVVDARRQKDLSFHGQTLSQAQEKMRKAVDRYPAALRAGAAKAIGLIGGRSAITDRENSMSPTDELETIRQPERERVEKLMRAASTDIELWQVLEREVFPMIAKLGLDDKSESILEAPKGRKGRKKKGAVTSQTDSARSDEMGVAQLSEEPQLDLGIHGPLYPSYLLLGLRLLDREFAKPSPLVLNILPRIKSFGLISHVLGGSTALYNELLRIYWYRYDDFRGVSQLLTEMDQAALDFDAETLGIVKDINRKQDKIREEERHKMIKQVWSMPEYRPGQFRDWQSRIEAAIDERGAELAQDLSWEH